MADHDLPLFRRQLLESLGAGAALVSIASGQAIAQSSITDDPPVKDVEVQENVMVEMRDGVELATDVYLPDLPGESEASNEMFPTLLARTPYNKESFAEQAEAFAQHKYAVVVQDVRGRYASRGEDVEFVPHRNEPKDSHDTIEWAAEQSWSNGRVGTYGVSYMASTQWGTFHNEENNPPDALKTMVPGFGHAGYYHDSVYPGGALLLSHTLNYNHGLAIDLADSEEFTELEAAYEAIQQLYWDLPVDPYEPMEAAGYDFIDTKFKNETYNEEHWAILDHTTIYDEVDIPVLNYGGWYDIYTQGTIQNFVGVREEGGQSAREGSMLVMGPYTHAAEDIQAQGLVAGGAYTFPENSTLDSMALHLEWFDRILKEDSETAEDPPVRLYVPGLDEWIGADDFPPEAATATRYYLHSDGDANIGDIDDTNYTYNGQLSTEAPGDEEPDEYTYDPSDPVVTVGGYNLRWRAGIADRATAYHDRDDILVYETDILKEDVAVIGPITATLYASTSAVDTDFVVTVSDVDPTDSAGALLVAEGARRGRLGDVSDDPRYSDTYTEISYLEPNEVYEWKIGVWPTARVFEEGHRIRVDITSSDFPRYNRNLNSGEGLTGTEMVEADQTIYHDNDNPSCVEIPIMPVDELEEMVLKDPI